jgi:hypothetical protein
VGKSVKEMRGEEREREKEREKKKVITNFL